VDPENTSRHLSARPNHRLSRAASFLSAAMSPSSSVFLVTLVTACLVAVTVGDIAAGPQNGAAYANTTTTISCQATTAGTERVYFIEYTTGTQRQISDGDQLLAGHPNVGRYQLVVNSATGVYTLSIMQLVAADAGTYECIDANQTPTSIAKRSQLVVLAARMNYTTTIPSTGIVNLNFYYTTECRSTYAGSAAPFILWSGPSPFTQIYTNSTTQAWGGLAFTAAKTHDAQQFVCNLYFRPEQFASSDPNVATNVPTLTESANTGLIFLQWTPFNITYYPVQPSYEIGQVITCWADGLPTVRYVWSNVITQENYPSQTLTLTPAMVGVQALRCQASNTVGSVDLFQNITVNPITTTTPTPSTTPTTTVAPVADCDPLNGRWEATRDDGSTVALCLHFDDYSGLMQGLLVNNTNLDSFYTDIVGVLRSPSNNEFGVTTLYALGGVGAFAGECRKCYGTEHMLVNGVSRNSGNAFFCNIGSELIQSPSLTFWRTAVSAPCPPTTSAWKAHIAKRAAERRRK
jgi:hypothetical protein